MPVPEGAHVIVSQYVTHRDPEHFPDPERFDPTRWLDGLERRLPRGAYVPFGAGTRRCLGDRFAMLEGRLILLAAIAIRADVPLATVDRDFSVIADLAPLRLVPITP